MKTIVLIAAVAAYGLGATAAYATGCHHACAEGYTYSTEQKTCVPKQVSS